MNSDFVFLDPHLFDFLQLVIVLQEEGQIHEGDVHLCISTVLPVLFHSVFSSGERMFVDL